MELMKSMIVFDKQTMSFKSKVGFNYIPSSDVSDTFINFISKFNKEDVAASLQLHLHKIVTEYIEALIDENGHSNIVLSGGVFANVKLNQRIKEVNGVKSIFIHPNMGDGGLGMGGALFIHNETYPVNIKLNNVYFGNEYSDKEIKIVLDNHHLNYKYHKDPSYVVAELLAKGKVIGRFDGRMEYGARALGNRSVLYQTTDKSVNDWLNKNLARSEFMPFAPVTISKFANKCYKNLKGAEYAAKFMTITFDCTDCMKETSPAVVHVDDTARPQLIDEKTNPKYFKIVDEYRKITGIPSLINTSFNMHEEPIVCSPEDAIKSFRQGKLDYLLIGNHLVKRK